MLYYLTYQSPVGLLQLMADDKYILAVEINPNKIIADGPVPVVLIKAQKWLDEYFSGKIPSTRLPLKIEGTIFLKKVLHALTQLNYGEVITYGELAKRVGSHPRAVGQALGMNPLPILIPCHRIVSSTGLGGYTPGIEIKKTLLKLESDNAPEFTVGGVFKFL